MRVLVLVVLALLSVSGVGAQAELPPYIHYFDHLRGGLVIERANWHRTQRFQFFE